jgi:hypothetical protein
MALYMADIASVQVSNGIHRILLRLQLAFGVVPTLLPLLFEFIVPRNSHFLVLWLYWHIDFVVFDCAVRRFPVQTFHVTSDHGHLLSDRRYFAIQSHFCPYWNRPEV